MLFQVGGGGREGAGVSDEELLSLKQQLAESEALMKELSMSWEERLKASQTILIEHQKVRFAVGVGAGVGVTRTCALRLGLPESAYVVGLP